MTHDEEKQKRALRRKNKTIAAKKRDEAVKITSSKDKFADCKKHTIKRIDGNPRKAGIKTVQELKADEALESQLEDVISDVPVVEFLVDEALTKLNNE
jgi:hypothetical protein